MHHKGLAMMDTARCLLRTAFALVAIAAGMAHAAPPSRPVDQFIVRYKADTRDASAVAARRSTLDALGREHGVSLQVRGRLGIGADVIRSDRALDAASAKRLLMQLRADPRVAYAQVDAWVQPALVPNDPYYDFSQWNLRDIAGIRAPLAWDLSAGFGTVVAVLDTGRAPHPDLDANIAGGYDFISDPLVANDGDGRDMGFQDPGDYTVTGQCGAGIPGHHSTWHGTKVGGTVAALTNNGVGIAGVAFRSQLLQLRVMGTCGGRVSDIADAITWASGGNVIGPGLAPRADPVEVINLSFSAPGACDPALQNAIDGAVAAGVVVVAAAGNQSTDAAVAFPGNCANVITVASSDAMGRLSSFSNYGGAVELLAPGGGYEGYGQLPVPSNTGLSFQKDPWISFDVGTSLAAAQVSGVVAMMQARHANTPAAVAAILANTARPLPAGCPAADGCGAGIVEASQAVRAAIQPSVFFYGAPVVAEGNTGTTTATFTLRLSQPLAQPVTFDIATFDGTATHGVDFDALSLVDQTFAPGQTQRQFTVTIHGDTEAEPDETFTLALTRIVGAGVLAGQAKAKILTDDVQPMTPGVPVPNLSSPADANRYFSLQAPPNAKVQFKTQGGPGDVDLFVYYGKLGGTPACTSNSPYSQETCDLSTDTGGIYYVRLNAFTAYTGITLTATVDVPTMSIDDIVLVEGDSGTKVVEATLRMSRSASAQTTVDLVLTGGTATLGADVVDPGVVHVSFPSYSVVVRKVAIATIGDTEDEPNETFGIELENPFGVTLADGHADVTLLNNDGPALTIASVAVAEGDSGTRQAVFTVRLSQPAPGPVSYTIATVDGTARAGIDYDPLVLTDQVIPAGMLSKTFAVPLHGDTTLEDNETVGARLSQATGASVLLRENFATILNDDGPTLSIRDVGVREGDSGQKLLQVVVRLSQPAATDVGYLISTSNISAANGSDYTGFILRAQVMPAGETTRVYEIPIQGDTAVEANESFAVTLYNPTHATLFDRQAIAAIYNDDGPVLAINDVAIKEGNAGTKVATFTVLMTQAAPSPVTFDIATSDGTATAGSDYVARSLVGETIPAGQLSKTFTVTLLGDTVAEPDESFRVTLGNPSAGATIIKPIGIATITNDD
jgi:serine protease